MGQIIKIGLVLAVVAAIVYFVMLPEENKSPPPIEQTENDPIEEIEGAIERFSRLSDTTFEYRRRYYSSWKDSIRDKRLSDNEKNRLTKLFYYEYVDMFITQALVVFNGTDWKNEDLKIIRSEYQDLWKSKWLTKDSPTDTAFAKIREYFRIYDEVDRFITACKSASFPVSDFRDKINSLNDKRYQDWQLVNQCTRLKNGLEEIPKVLFRKHVSYLDNKIKKSSGKYSEYKSKNDYLTELYDPLKAEIDSLDNNIYNVDASDFKREYRGLLDKWKNDGDKASDHFSNQIPIKITEYLRGNELDKDTLKNYSYRKDIDFLKKDIQICLDFWELDGSNGKTYKTLHDRIQDSRLTFSNLRKFLDKVYKEENPSYDTEYKRSGLERVR